MWLKLEDKSKIILGVLDLKIVLLNRRKTQRCREKRLNSEWLYVNEEEVCKKIITKLRTFGEFLYKVKFSLENRVKTR